MAGQCGYSADLSDAIVNRTMFHSDNTYYIPDVLINGLRCKTHTVSNTAFRGFGGPQGIVTMENVIDEIAFKVKKDPLLIRKQNFYDTESRNITPYYQQIETFNIPSIVEKSEKNPDIGNVKKVSKSLTMKTQSLKKGLH